MSRTFYDIFKNKLFSAEDNNVPDGMWGKIAQEIPVYKEPRTGKRGWVWLSAFLLVGAVAVVGWQQFNGEEEEVVHNLQSAVNLLAEDNIYAEEVSESETVHRLQSPVNVVVEDETIVGEMDESGAVGSLLSAANLLVGDETAVGEVSESEAVGSPESAVNLVVEDETIVREVSQPEAVGRQRPSVDQEVENEKVSGEVGDEIDEHLEDGESQTTSFVQRNTNEELPGIFSVYVRKSYEASSFGNLARGLQINKQPDPECYSFGNRKQSNLSIDIYGGPGYAIRPLKSRDDEVSGYILARESTETYQYAFQLGARINLMLNNGLAVRTGIHFSQVGERYDLTREGDIRLIKVEVTEYVFDASGMIIDSVKSFENQLVTGTTIKKIFNRYKALDIPILFGYELPLGKMNVGLNVGPVLNISSWQRGQFLDPALESKHIDLEDPVNYFPAYKTTLGIGGYIGGYVTYPIGKKTALFAEPHVLHRFQSITFDTYSIDQRHTQIGLNIGLRFNL